MFRVFCTLRRMNFSCRHHLQSSLKNHVVNADEFCVKFPPWVSFGSLVSFSSYLPFLYICFTGDMAFFGFQVCTLEACFTDIHWYPSMSQRQRSGAGTDIFVAACTDGRYMIRILAALRSIFRMFGIHLSSQSKCTSIRLVGCLSNDVQFGRTGD